MPSIFKISPSVLKGSIDIPPSKSHTMRAILFGSLGVGKTVIEGYLKSPDTWAMVEAMRTFGAQIDVRDTALIISGLEGKLRACENVIDAGNSGQVLRFVGCLAALLPTYTVMTGDHSIRHNRPVLPMLEALTQLGALAVSSRLDGMAPIIVRGPIQAGYAKLPGEDSQPVSGLLIAAAFLHGTTHLEVTQPGEKPWIDLTLAWLNKLGARVTHQNYERYTITGPLSYPGFSLTVPGDFSSAAFPLVAALITQSSLTLNNLDLDEVQGDKKMIDVLENMGASLIYNRIGKALTVYPTKRLQGVTIDANEIIDAVPVLAVMGCFAEGKTEIINAAIARHKESDRLRAITSELRKMGACIEEHEDRLIITEAPLKGATMSSHSDHRIAMALSVAALGAKGDSRIEGVECIAKSYPGFSVAFQSLGAQMEETP